MWRFGQKCYLSSHVSSCYLTRNGVYPLTAFALMPSALVNRPRATSPEVAESVKSETPEPPEHEVRMAVNMQCQVRRVESTPGALHVSSGPEF